MSKSPILDRRSFVQLSAAMIGLSRFPMTVKASSVAARGPRYLMVFFLPGGIDSIYTFEPKTKSEVETWVDVPYPSNDIFTSGSIIGGPHLKPIQAHLGRFNVIRGIQVFSANHDGGNCQIARMRTRVTTDMPTLFDIIGLNKEEQIFPVIGLGCAFRYSYTSGWFGSNRMVWNSLQGMQTFEELEKMPAEQRHIAAKILREGAAKIMSKPGSRDKSIENMTRVAAFLESQDRYSTFTPEKWDEDADGQLIANDMQRSLWVLENDIGKSIYNIASGKTSSHPWDSHTDNAANQTEWNGKFFRNFNRFLDRFFTLENTYGKISDNTAIIVTSELGRFPRINEYRGKDHLSQISMLYYHPALQNDPSIFGDTDRTTLGFKVNPRTGKPDSGGNSITLDDLGATLVYQAGINPEVFGYGGHILPFLGA